MSDTINKEQNKISKPSWLKKGYERIPNEYRKAFWLTLYSLGGIVVIIFIFIVGLRAISTSAYNSVEHFIQNNELVWVVAMGMLGIFFAIRAMFEASNALTKSTEILTAISSFFDNYDQATERIDKLISEAKNELLILVSLPAYGIIVNDKLGDIFYSVMSKRFPDCNTKMLKIQFICFNQDLCTKYENKFKTDNKKMFDKYMLYKREILEGIHNIRSLNRQSEPNYENIWLLGMDTHIRLFIADDSKAIFATVPDFKPDTPMETSIAGFETNEKKMVQILIKLFEEQKRSGSSMSEADFRTFKFE